MFAARTASMMKEKIMMLHIPGKDQHRKVKRNTLLINEGEAREVDNNETFLCSSIYFFSCDFAI